MLRGAGDQALLGMPLTAFFASRQCPGIAIRAAMDWALEQARARRAVISGFHSPLEQSVLNIILEARSPAILVLARPIAGARLKTDWTSAVNAGYMTVVSTSTDTTRLTIARAAQRNNVVAQLSDNIVIAHAGAGGQLARQSAYWAGKGTPIHTLAVDVSARPTF